MGMNVFERGLDEDVDEFAVRVDASVKGKHVLDRQAIGCAHGELQTVVVWTADVSAPPLSPVPTGPSAFDLAPDVFSSPAITSGFDSADASDPYAMYTISGENPCAGLDVEPFCPPVSPPTLPNSH